MENINPDAVYYTDEQKDLLINHAAVVLPLSAANVFLQTELSPSKSCIFFPMSFETLFLFSLDVLSIYRINSLTEDVKVIVIF